MPTWIVILIIVIFYYLFNIRYNEIVTKCTEYKIQPPEEVKMPQHKFIESKRLKPYLYAYEEAEKEREKNRRNARLIEQDKYDQYEEEKKIVVPRLSKIYSDNFLMEKRKRVIELDITFENEMNMLTEYVLNNSISKYTLTDIYNSIKKEHEDTLKELESAKDEEYVNILSVQRDILFDKMQIIQYLLDKLLNK